MLGASNPLPFRVGGGLTPSERAYRQMRHAMGEGGTARDQTGIDGLWRRSRAKGLAAGASAERRSLLQAFPRFATDLLPYYERILKITPPSGASEAERREVVAVKFYEEAPTGTAELGVLLAAVDPRITLRTPPASGMVETMFGRAFEAHEPTSEGPAFNLAGGRKHSNLPNLSSHAFIRVRFALGYTGAPTVQDRIILARVRELLRTWAGSDVEITVSTGPWVIGLTPVGLGAVG